MGSHQQSWWFNVGQLTEPKGKNAWSQLMLGLFGRYSYAYQQVIKSLEMIVQERFHMETGRLRTDSLEEYLPGYKLYENQRAIKVEFDHAKGIIKFWKNKLKKPRCRFQN